MTSLWRRFRAWLGMELLLGLDGHEPRRATPSFPVAHTPSCECFPCLAQRARQREAQLAADIAAWNDATSRIPTSRWQPFKYPETRQ